MHRINHLLNHLVSNPSKCETDSINPTKTSLDTPYPYESHHSWTIKPIDITSNTNNNTNNNNTQEVTSVLPILDSFQCKGNNPLGIPISSYASYYQHDLIPVYDASKLNFNNKNICNDIYNQFFHRSGAIIISNAYLSSTMNEYNKWCENFLEYAKIHDKNIRHPKQPGKYMINDVMLRLSKDNPSLLLKLINNDPFIKSCDALLGFSKFGALTTHWIEPLGDRQLSHVDYPIHVGQEIMYTDNIIKNLKLSNEYNKLNKKQKELLRLRLEAPYPRNTKIHT